MFFVLHKFYSLNVVRNSQYSVNFSRKEGVLGHKMHFELYYEYCAICYGLVLDCLCFSGL